MARPMKRRRVCGLPENNAFGPLDGQRGGQQPIHMTVDEYETIRLIDLEGLNQEACAEQMHVARTTVQGIYISARKKLAQALVEGVVLLIEGGEYHLCEGDGPRCGRGCRRRGLGQDVGKSPARLSETQADEKGRNQAMKIAIPVDGKSLDAQVSTSFGRTAYFLVYDTETKTDTYIDNAAIAAAGGAGIKAAQVVVDAGATILLTPRCGENAANVLQAADIKLVESMAGTAQENVDAYMAGKLTNSAAVHEGFHGQGAQ